MDPSFSKPDVFPYKEKYYFSQADVNEIPAFKVYQSTKTLGSRCPLNAFYHNSLGRRPAEGVETGS